MSKRSFPLRRIKKILLTFLLILGLSGGGVFLFWKEEAVQPPIKVGILHSLSGTLAISEFPLVDATLLAIEEINEAGGVLGRLIEPKFINGASDSKAFGRGAQELIRQEKVDVIFGCWTSASRKEVKEVVEAQKHLLFYPVQYEGVEQSDHIVYTGAVPNQQLIPAVVWAAAHFGKRFFIVGSDYVFPRVGGEILKRTIHSLGGEVVGEKYIPLGTHNLESIVQSIGEKKPSVVLNLINGDSNLSFFNSLKRNQVDSQQIPVFSFSIAETEAHLIGPEKLAGHYVVSSYFQSIESSVNDSFKEHFKKNYGPHRVISDSMESAYFGVYLWKQSAEKAQSSDPRKVLDQIGGQVYSAPEGIIYTDMSNHHTWKFVRIGKVRADGQFDIVWNSEQPIEPLPYLIFYQSQNEWEAYLQTLYQMWGNRWENVSGK